MFLLHKNVHVHHDTYANCQSHVSISGSVLAEISAWAPKKWVIFIICKYFLDQSVRNTNYFILETVALVSMR